jgi:DNA-binding transcriptional regulator YiaG
MAKVTKKPLIKNYRDLRSKCGLNQSKFWSRLGVTQSAGSRYETGRAVPKPTAVLAHVIYVQGLDIDASQFK